MHKGVKWEVGYAARSGANYFIGGNTELSKKSKVETITNETDSITATIPAVKGAVAYDWYLGVEGEELFYVTTTTTGKVVFTTAPTAKPDP